MLIKAFFSAIWALISTFFDFFGSLLAVLLGVLAVIFAPIIWIGRKIFRRSHSR